ncbi:uncharacterized protein [Ptychodera flava]|uniref:uncharacterized protein n=1 Tax=Ptychodera flava TaxID=63121 RepID=UPI00396A575C
MGKFTIVSWLKETMKESSMGSVRADKLWSRFEEATACTTNMRKSLGKTLKKIFPNIVVSTTRDKATKKTVNLYRGITWKSDSSHHDESVSLHDMRQYIPDTAIVLPRCGSDCIKLAIPSKIISNGNIVLKQIDIYRDHWELSIRGKNVDLRAIDIDSSLCTLSKDTIPEILSLVDKVKVCTGLPAKLTTNGHSMQYSSKCE